MKDLIKSNNHGNVKKRKYKEITVYAYITENDIDQYTEFDKCKYNIELYTEEMASICREAHKAFVNMVMPNAYRFYISNENEDEAFNRNINECMNFNNKGECITKLKLCSSKDADYGHGFYCEGKTQLPLDKTRYEKKGSYKIFKKNFLYFSYGNNESELDRENINAIKDQKILLSVNFGASAPLAR